MWDTVGLLWSDHYSTNIYNEIYLSLGKLYSRGLRGGGGGEAVVYFASVTGLGLSILSPQFCINPLNPELNPICYLLALLAHHFLHVSRVRVKSLTIRLLMLYIYGAPILDVSRSHTTTQHSR